jgi:hypothetical protein
MNNLKINKESAIERTFKAALKVLVNKAPLPELEVEFYPYTGLTSKIKMRGGRIYARVSDILKDAPTEVLFALACILIAKLYRRRIPLEQSEIYRDYSSLEEIREAVDTAKRERGYKWLTLPQGDVYDLSQMFDDLNRRYFGGKLRRPALSWSRQDSRRILGHQDHIHDAIVLSRNLDDVKTPPFVVEYFLYHEMLHIKHPTRLVNDRKVMHGSDFRADERKFERFEEAKKWLEDHAAPVRRRRRKR